MKLQICLEERVAAQLKQIEISVFQEAIRTYHPLLATMTLYIDVMNQYHFDRWLNQHS